MKDITFIGWPIAAALLVTFATNTFADTTSDLPACTMADVTAALASDTNCSLQNTVVYGPTVLDFVTTQCAPFAVSPGNSDANAKRACTRCAKNAWAAFMGAAKAKLITARASRENSGQIRRLCGTNNSSDEGDTDDSDALKSLYGQLRLCLPQDGQSVEPSQCSSCALTALAAALENGVINRSKFEVMKASVQAACARRPSREPHATPTPASSPAPEENTLKKYGQALKACFDRFVTGTTRETAACLSCVDAVDTTGLDPNSVSQYQSYAHSYCSGSFVQPTPQPTPASGENSFSKFGQGLNACFAQYLTPSGNNPAGCISCINSVDATGLNPTYVSQYLTYATAHCNGTNI